MRVQLLEGDPAVRAMVHRLLLATGSSLEPGDNLDLDALSDPARQPDLLVIGSDHAVNNAGDFRAWLRERRPGSFPPTAALIRAARDCSPELVEAGFDDIIALDAGEPMVAARLAILQRRATHEKAAVVRRRALPGPSLIAAQTNPSVAAAVMDHAPDLFWIKDRDLRIIHANPATAATFGMESPQDLIGKTDHDLFHPSEADRFRRREMDVLETGVPMAGTLEESTRLGDAMLAVLATKFPLRDADGAIIGLVGILRDVTELVEARNRVAASDDHFRKLIQHSSDVLLVIDRDANIKWMAPSVERVLGRARSERIGRSAFDHVLEEDQPRARIALATALASPEQTHSVLLRARAADGSVRSILNTVTNLIGTEVDGLVLNGRDVTETIEAEDRLRREQESARLALAAAKVAAWRFDVAEDTISLTPLASAAFGLAAIDTRLSLAQAEELFHPEDRRLIAAQHISQCLFHGQIDLELRAIWPDGSVHWLEVKGGATHDSAGRIERLAGVVFDVTARKEIEAKLKSERAMLDNVMNHGPDAVYIKDRESRFTRVNRLVSEHFGFKDPVEMIGKTVFDLFPREEAKSLYADEQRVLTTGKPILNRLDCVRRSSSGDIWILTSLAPIRDERDEIVGLIGTSRDVTHYSLDDRQLAIAEMRYRLVVEQIPAITCLYSIKNGEHAYEFISPQVEQMLGFTPAEYSERWMTEPDSMFHPDDRDRMTGAVERVNSAHAAATLEYRHRVKDGGWKWVREIASPLPGDDPDHYRWQGMIFDLTEDRALTERLEHQVCHDPLTGLPNRVLLSQRLDLVIARTDRSKRGFALLFVDIDDFKRINDSMGHQSGDAALIAIAERLRELTRTGDTVARLGGDEFVVLLSDISGPRNAYEIAERVQRSFKQPFEVEGTLIKLSASIGVSIHDRERTAPDVMLREADAAMYEAKRAGRGRTRIFDSSTRITELANLSHGISNL